jgi:peroxiredoxin Q/BCP
MARIPAFSLPGSDGRTHSADSLAGTAYILYFYPKDMTPGCTTESCDFRDRHEALRRLGVRIFGVSCDTLASHARFIAKESLNFPLLSDEGHVLAEKLGVWGEKKNYGKTYLGIIRSTFLVGKDGSILRAWRQVKVAGHADEVLAAAQELTG